ncbi:hypothetical protein, partial [Methanobrevibacter sp.]|uniref:hypothetical protein n=1 Tax=Methanobrevibacter sp. TaxID=66852 RepID=UPI0026DFA399
DDNYSNDFGYLEFKVTAYLDRYGDCFDENWTECEDFHNNYQAYLANPDNYSLNESNENYETYLKIYESIVSTFDDYNLTDNETQYLKFVIMYYLNNYGNCSNFTENESDGFSRYCPAYLLTATFADVFESETSPAVHSKKINEKDQNEPSQNSKNSISTTWSNGVYSNSVGMNNSADLSDCNNLNNSTITSVSQNAGESNLIMLFMVILVMVLAII